MKTTPVFVAKVFFLGALLCLFGAKLPAQCPLPTPTIGISQVGAPNAVAHGSFCLGERVQLNAQLAQNIADLRFQWQRDGNDIAGATQSIYVANQNGIYTVRIETPTCAVAARSNPITIKIEDCTPSGRVRIKGGSLEEDINDLLDFSTGTVTMGNATYKYRQEKVNGVNKVVFVDQSTNEDVVSFNYSLSGSSLTLTSDNIIMGTTARERAQEAIGWAAIFGFGTANFPRITSATDASYGAFIVNASK